MIIDLLCFVLGLIRYLNGVHNIPMPPSQLWHCKISIYFLMTGALISSLLVVSMTFDRLYGIIRPHKAASFNTVKRAKITSLCIASFCFLYDVPLMFVSTYDGGQCVPFGSSTDWIYTEVYYWFNNVTNFTFPFLSLLIMNSVIIHKLRKRAQRFKVSRSNPRSKSKMEDESVVKNSETQIYVLLLLVTFSFLILMTPGYGLFFFINFYDYFQSAHSFAAFHLFFSVAQKTYHTNFAINFYLYVISGHKFRTDLVNLFHNLSLGKSSTSTSGSSDAARY